MDSVFSVIGFYIDWDVRSLLLFTAVFILTADYIKNRRPDSFPPGPRTFPVVGNIFTVDYNRTHESMTQLAGKYGDVFSLRMGQTWIVVLNRFEVLKEALVNQGDSLVDRPDSPLEWDIGHGLGVGFSNGNTWKQQRRFALSTLKYFGFGKKSLEPVILNEFMHCAKDFISHKCKQCMHSKPLTMNKEQADSTFNEENLVMSVLDLFVAGSETTATTLRWAFLYMAKYPEIQAKVQAEIDEVIGQSRQVSMEEHANLPYTDAVIHEIQRMGNIVPLSVPHVTNRDIQLGSYTIPKKEWKTPNTFNPGHFVKEEGKFVKPAAFIPFSAGKRACLRENLARMELFLFSSTSPSPCLLG